MPVIFAESIKPGVPIIVELDLWGNMMLVDAIESLA